MKSLLSLLHVYSVLGYSLRSVNSNRAYSLLNYTHLLSNFGKNQCIMLARDISDWNFTQSKLHSLPLDEIKANYVRRNVKEAIFSEVVPTPLQTELKLVDFSEDVLVNILDMDPAITDSSEFLEFVAGNKVLSSSVPLAHRYGGYQFGVWASQLGDGRAILLGEYVNKKGEHWELQLKGAGQTPYSRDGDGRAVLRSSVREFLASEAMHYLGIPTSRAAALVVSDDLIIRDPLYNGNIRRERAAVVLRLAPTWFRFGSLEILAKTGELALLKQLTDFIIQEHFPDINPTDENKYVAFYSTLAHSTLNMLIGWQSIGFAHGVLNTDNMSILGLTIDYGPFGFCEAYDPQMIPNHSDSGGRYSFDNQMEMVAWNLEKLSIALSPLLNESQKKDIAGIVRGLSVYTRRQLRTVMREKVGLCSDRDDDHTLLMCLTEMMEQNGGDFTMTFRQLGEISVDDLMNEDALEERRFWSLKRLYQHEKYPVFVDIYRKRLLEDQVSEAQRREQINRLCPRYILRNWMAQSAIQKAENNDFSEVRLIQKVLRTPFTVQDDAEKAGYSGPTPDWANALKVSCSS